MWTPGTKPTLHCDLCLEEIETVFPYGREDFKDWPWWTFKFSKRWPAFPGGRSKLHKVHVCKPCFDMLREQMRKVAKKRRKMLGKK